MNYLDLWWQLSRATPVTANRETIWRPTVRVPPITKTQEIRGTFNAPHIAGPEHPKSYETGIRMDAATHPP